MTSDMQHGPRDLFISYAREDLQFVRELDERFVANGHTTWVDYKGIPPSTDWFDTIREAIRSSAAFAFVISPHSVASETCLLELAHATEVGKRVIPILRREAQELPEALAKLQWISMRNSDDLDQAITDLVTALSLDVDWLRLHSRIIVRAREWAETGRTRGELLLRGQELDDAETGRDRSMENGPHLAPLDSEFITASRHAVTLELEAAARREQSSRSRQLAAQSEFLRTKRPDLSVLLALKAAAISSTMEARRCLFNRVSDTRNIDRCIYASEPLARVALSPDGKILATGAGDAFLRKGDYSIELHSLGTQQNARTLGRHNSKVQYLQFTDNGNYLASVSFHEAIIWDVATKEERFRLSNPSANEFSVGHVSCSSNRGGDRLAFSYGKTLLVWQWKDGATWQVPRHHEWVGVNVALHPTRSLLCEVPMVENRSLWLVDFINGREVKELSGLAGVSIDAPAFSPDGRYLVVAANKWEDEEELGSLISFDVDSDGPATELFRVESRRIKGFTFAQENPNILLVFAGHELLVCDSTSGRVIESLKGHPQNTSIEGICAGKGGTAVSCDSDGRAILWQTSQHTQLEPSYEPETAIHSIAFSRDGHQLVSCDARGALHFYSLAKIDRASADAPLQFLSNPDVHELSVNVVAESTRFQLVHSDSRMVGANRLCLAHNSNLIFVGQQRGTLSQVDWRGNPIAEPIDTGMNLITIVAASFDDELVACGDAEGRVGIWETRTGRRRAWYEELATPIYGLAFSPDVSLLAIGPSEQPRAVLWDVVRSEVAAKLEESLMSGVGAVLFSPDGTRLLVGGTGIAMTMWDVERRQVIGRYRTIQDGVVSLEANPNDGVIAAGTVEFGTIALLDAASGALIGEFGVGELIFSLAFHAKEGLLASAGEWGSIRLWDTGIIGWSACLRNRISRSLSAQERREFIDIPEDREETAKQAWSHWFGEMTLEEVAGAQEYHDE